jgi:hypothetical protein
MNKTNTTAATAEQASTTTPWSGITNSNQILPTPLGSHTHSISSVNGNPGTTLIGSGIYGNPQYPSIGASINYPGTVTIHGGQVATYGAHNHQIAPQQQTAFMFYKWNFGYDFPRELMESGAPLVPAVYITNAKAMMFHISVWTEICKPNKSDFGVIWDGEFNKYSATGGPSDEAEGVLMIKQGKTLDEFKVWWAEYINRFDGDNWKTEQLPSMKEGMEISGCPIKHNKKVSYNGKQIMASDELFDSWCWIVERTHQPVWFTEQFWFFNNTSEMLMYKLIDEK